MSLRDKLKAMDLQVPEAAEPEKPKSPEPEPEPELDDEALFLKAVEDVSREAILDKFDRSDPSLERPESDDEPAQKEGVRDQALFLQWVDEMGIDKKG